MWYDEFTKLTPVPQRWEKLPARYAFRPTIAVCLREVNPAREKFLWDLLKSDLERLLKRSVRQVRESARADITLIQKNSEATAGAVLPVEGYALTVNEKGAVIWSETDQGLSHAVQTLLQLAAMGHQEAVLRHGHILDWPHYRQRWLMADMGRAPFSLNYLKRLVRIAARLKYNGLQLHTNDNELNAVRYEGTELGKENPFALTLVQYAELIRYARDYQVEIIPEVESWGHAGSILLHYPHLYGATRLHGRGHSFGIGPATFELLGKLYDQWFDILPAGSWFHVGMDEANWRLLPDADPSVYTKANLVRIVYELFQDRAKAHGKHFRIIMWQDWKYPKSIIPDDLRNLIVAVPWHYHSVEKIKEQLQRLSVREAKAFNRDGKVRLPFMSGGGVSGIHELGALTATLEWAVRARDFPNCLGLYVLLWGTNDLLRCLISIYHGADCAWNPLQAKDWLPTDVIPEDAWGNLAGQMKIWQALFPDVDPDAMRQEAGEEVLMGIYRWGGKFGQPVAPLWMPAQPFLGDAEDSAPAVVPAPASVKSAKRSESPFGADE
ncbi:MAG: family 20 glycosylhydrolase [Verrucomicrobia bacterium]|nr:family 20 glycosylhydrolase [Verrucomicrobiota bacterium]